MGIYKLRTEFATHLKVLLWFILVIFVVGAVYMFKPGATTNNNKESKKVIIKVGDTEIKNSVFESEWQKIFDLASSRGIKSPLQFASIKGMIINDIIDSQKLIMVAEKQGIKISKKEIKTAMDTKILEDLKNNRTAVMGKLTPEEEKVDPRKDKKYLKALSDNGMNIDTLINSAKNSIPELKIKAELAQKAFTSKAEKTVAGYSDSDIERSYNSYTVKQIIIDPSKSTETKAMETAQKLVKDIKAGGDFDKLKAANSAVMSMPDMDYNAVDAPFLLPHDVAEKVIRLKVGEVTDAIKSDTGIYIVKLVRTHNTKPAKFDAAVKKERKNAIKMALEQEAFTKLQAEMKKITDVTVIDPELSGYCNAYKAQTEYDPAKSKVIYKEAMADFEKALKAKKDASKTNDLLMSQMAFVSYQLGDYKGASKILYNILDSKDSQMTESYDLRMLSGDCYVKLGEKEKAIVQYENASELNRTDSSVHETLAGKYIQLGATEKAALETKKAADIKKWEAKQQKNQDEMPQPAK